MASCLAPVTIYAYDTPGSTGKTGYTVFVANNSTPVSSCSHLAINASEYSQLSRGFIDNPEDAQLIAGSFILLLTIGFIYKAIRKALDAGDVSDEAH